MKIAKSAFVASALIAMLCLTSPAGVRDTVDWSFVKKDRISIQTVSGDCIVEKGSSDSITVSVEHRYHPRDSFEPVYRERGNTLILNERIYGSNSGRSIWRLTVPDGLEIEFETASGSLAIIGLEGRFSASTASGRVQIEDCRGTYDFNTASGDIELISCKGEFDVNTASGAITADGISLQEASGFNTASGRVRVTLAESAGHDLDVGTASGRAELSYGGNAIEGTIEMTAKDRSGRITAPFDFDDEETFRRWGERYVRKTTVRGKDTPFIQVSTASGRAVLRAD